MDTSLSSFTTRDYQEILNLTNHLAIVLTCEGRCLKTSEKSLLGWTPDETLGRSVADFIVEADLALVKVKLSELNECEGVSKNFRIRCKRKLGGYRWIAWSAVRRGEYIYSIGVDETNKMEIETAIAVQTMQQTEYQSRFTTFFEQSTLPMEIYSLSGEPLAVNKAWEDLFQTTRAEIEKYNVLEDPHVKNTPFGECMRRAWGGESVEVPAFFYDPALIQKIGRSRWLEAWISPVKDDSGKIREIAMILKDVTEKIETQQALVRTISERKAAEEKYQVISDRFALAAKTANIGLWEWTPGSNFVKWDETTEKIFGYERGTFPMTSEAFTGHIHPEDREFAWSTIVRAMVEKKSYIVDHRGITCDGRELWLQASGMALYDAKGSPYHMMGTTIDITDRKNSESDQKFLSVASEYLLGSFDHREILQKLCKHAINYFSDGCIIDELLPDGKLKRMLVEHPDQKIASMVLELDEKFPNCYTHGHPFQNVINTGQTAYTRDTELVWDQIRRTYGEDFYAYVQKINGHSSISVRLKGHEKVLGIMTFFTTKGSKGELNKRHIWLAEELAYRVSMAFENVLIHQQSLEAIKSRDEFLQIASHELKTPLQSLTLQNQMRKRNLEKNLLETFTPSKLTTMIDADLKHLSRIKRLIEDMLDISRIRAGKLTFVTEVFGVCSFVKDVYERFRPQMDAAGCQSLVLFSSEVKVNADMYRIEQVLVNVLTNAVKYGPGRPVEIIVSHDVNVVRIQVRDKGVGIRNEDIERIFERFERAISSNEVSGLGLGLYISRQIMQQHRGRLYAESHPGEGSIFTMELPVSHEA